MPFPRELILPLLVLLLVLAWIAALVGSVALTFRERYRPPEDRRWWARHAFPAWAAGSVALVYALSPVDWSRQGPGENPGLWVNLAFGLAVGLAPIAWGLARRRTSTAGRVQRKIRRGDLAGAIADVEAALGPHLEAPAVATPGGPAEVAADPWAPPASAGPTPRDRAALAERLNLLGCLEARRGDWARALALFERADGLGTGLMTCRTNRAGALITLGRPGEAGELVDQALVAMPEHDSALSVQLLTEAANHLAALGRPGEARAALGRAERHWRQLGPRRLAHRGQLLAPLRDARAAFDRPTADADAPA